VGQRRLATLSAARWGALLLAAGVGFFQARAARAAESEDLERAAAGLLAAKLAQPALVSPLDGPNAQFTLQSTSTDRTVSARVAYQIQDSVLGDLLLDLKLSGPISSSGETRLADLDGLRTSTSVDAGISWIRWHPSADPKRQQAICDAYKRTLPGADAADFTCTLQELPAGSEYRRRFAQAIDWGTPLLLKLRYKVGRREFHFVDPATLERDSESRTGYSITAATGVLLDALGLVGFAYRFEEAFRAGAETDLCLPLGATGALACDPAEIGPPQRRQAHVLQAELRRFFGERLGVNPRISYEVKDAVVGLELPLYFLRDPDRGLNGGVSLGWRSDDDELVWSVFVGEALGVIF
jgi:hypothetical protein